MAFTPGYRAKVLNGDFSLSAKLAEASGAFSVEMLDSTTFADNGVKRFVAGLDSSTYALSGYVDAATAADSATWTDVQPLTYGPTGFAITSPVEMVNLLRSSYELGTPVGGLASFDISGTTDGFTDLGVTLCDLAAVTVDTNGTAVNGAASSANGGVAHLHVTAFSGFSSAVFIVEDSANGTSGWATIGTFSSVAAATSQRLAITGTVRQYTRCSVDVTGSGSVTFCVALARH